jgi:hypothetical protein
LMTRSRCRRRLASAGSPSKWSSSAMTSILTGETGAKRRWARGWKTHRNRDCNGCRARRGPSLVSGPLPLEGRWPPQSLAVAVFRVLTNFTASSLSSAPVPR